MSGNQEGKMREKRYFVAVLSFITLWIGTSFSLLAQTHSEAGFYTLEGNDFYFHHNSYFNRTALRSSSARIWYVYQPADDNPASQPLFVFFNGGPGGATSSGLLSAFTGRNAVSIDLETGEASIIKNPTSWTRVANLLHIDARTTGFSYSLMDDPQDDTLRQAEFSAKNYNCFVDGADFVRVLLRFLAAHPELQRNRVVIVPESYGGIRTIVMLHMLLYYQNYGNGQAVYQDPNLVQEIQNHYNTAYPEYSGQTVPPAVIAQQFSHQIMIQVALTRYYQRLIAGEMLEAPGSPLYQLAEETGVPYIPWRDQPGATGTPSPGDIKRNVYAYLEEINRDPYLIAMPDGFTSGFFDTAGALLSQYNLLNQMTGVDAAGIPEMYASTRQQAYKFKMSGNTETQILLSTQIDLPQKKRSLQSLLNPTSEDDLSLIFGTLQPWDRFFTDLNYDANLAFALNITTFMGYQVYYPSSRLYGQMFLENATWVETFITNADYDIVVYSPSIPRALALHTSILNGTQHDTVGPVGAARPGQILLDYIPGSVPEANVSTRIIRFPRYTKSGHAVTLTESAEMLADVIAWMENTGVFKINRQGEDQ